MVDIDSFAPDVGTPKTRGRGPAVHVMSNDTTSLTLLRQEGWYRWLPILFAIPLLIIFVRLTYVQIVRGADYRQLAEHNRLRVQVLPAPRGAIVDSKGQPLVNNVPSFALTITPADLPTKTDDAQIVIDNVAKLAKLSVQQVTTIITDKHHRRTDPATILDHVDYNQALSWMVTTADWPGVGITAVPTRQYPLGPAATPILGYVGKISTTELEKNSNATEIDITGKTGLEKVYNQQLTGTDGQREVERDVRNEGQQAAITRDAVPGATLHTSIDAGLQQRLYDQLLNAIHQAHSTAGAAVAINPQNGEILALASAPSYDDNWFVTTGHSNDITAALKSKQQPLLNRAITGEYPSGSIIKPLIGTGALAEHVITPDTTVLSTGGIKVGINNFPDWKPGGHGITNLAKAIADSVNTFFYEVRGGYQQQSGLGVDRIVKYLQLFGWGSPLGIDLPSEAAGLIPTKEWRTTKRPTPWRLGDTYHLAIGQGDLEVTPLQVATAIAAVANGGTLYQPHIVTSITSPDGKVLQTVQPKVLQNNIAPAADFAAVRNGMRQGVLAGSSRAMQSVPVPVAGKTGTAQFGVGDHTHAWYTAFAPYDHPTIAIAIVIEGGGEGHEIALPVAKDVFTWYFTKDNPVTGVDKSLTGQ